MVLPFKEQFVEPILAGTKILTIREDQHERWKEGRVIHMATGVRTKNYRQFHQSVCTGIELVSIIPEACRLEVGKIIGENVDWKPLSGASKSDFAISDGFQNEQAFFAYWKEVLEKKFDFMFCGRVIHWTAKRYNP